MIDRQWWAAAGVRAIKTFAQTTASVLSMGGIGVLDVDWIGAVSAGALAAVLSLLTSVGGLPELPNGGE